MDSPTAKELMAKLRNARSGFGYAATKDGVLFAFFVLSPLPEDVASCWTGVRTLARVGHTPLLFETLVTVDRSFFDHTESVARVAQEGIWLNSEDGGNMDFHAHLIPWSSVVWLVSHAVT